ncbi:MAG: hypothetical protein LBJ14_03260 [Desulfarculales bacterium]|jgi:predicted HicB family RNase H-like nuclease|nr:hypothetical protein [Desulfarculales bacterium]
MQDYFDYCQEQGEFPEKPFAVVLEPEVYERLSQAASSKGQPLEELASAAIKAGIPAVI